MLRREAVAILVSACARAAKLDRFFDAAGGAAVVLDVPGRKLIAAHGAAGSRLAPPGSTIKPFVLSALLQAGKLSAEETFHCPGKLEIAGRAFHCSHPPIAGPMRVPSALAYSCNCFAARVAERFDRGELARYLQRDGLASRTGMLGNDEAAGRLQPADGREANQLQALGEDRVLVTVAGLAAAYRLLAVNAPAPVIEGLEGAVEFGTAQLAGVSGMRVAGKTGSVKTSSGARFAWFSGFAPSRSPQIAVTVMLQGYSGGADAAPVAARIFDAWRAGLL